MAQKRRKGPNRGATRLDANEAARRAEARQQRQAEAAARPRMLEATDREMERLERSAQAFKEHAARVYGGQADAPGPEGPGAIAENTTFAVVASVPRRSDTRLRNLTRAGLRGERLEAMREFEAAARDLRAVELRQAAAARAARAAGVPWRLIGDSVGIKPDAARMRWG